MGDSSGVAIVVASIALLVATAAVWLLFQFVYDRIERGARSDSDITNCPDKKEKEDASS